MEKLQIKLLYAYYGWSVNDIARLLDTYPAVVSKYIEEMKLDKQSHLQETVDVTTPNPVAIADSEYTNGVRSLKTREVEKQLELAPIIATIELSLLQKVMEAAQAVDPENVTQLALIVKTFKTLTSDSIMTTLVKSDKEAGTAIAPQVAIQCMVFKD